MKQRAILQACDDVTKKKKLYEEKFGIELMPVEVVEGIVDETDFEEDKRGRYMRVGSSRLGFQTADVIDTTPSAFGELVFRGFVTVEYVVEHP